MTRERDIRSNRVFHTGSTMTKSSCCCAGEVQRLKSVVTQTSTTMKCWLSAAIAQSLSLTRHNDDRERYKVESCRPPRIHDDQQKARSNRVVRKDPDHDDVNAIALAKCSVLKCRDTDVGDTVVAG